MTEKSRLLHDLWFQIICQNLNTWGRAFRYGAWGRFLKFPNAPGLFSPSLLTLKNLIYAIMQIGCLPALPLDMCSSASIIMHSCHDPPTLRALLTSLMHLTCICMYYCCNQHFGSTSNFFILPRIIRGIAAAFDCSLIEPSTFSVISLIDLFETEAVGFDVCVRDKFFKMYDFWFWVHFESLYNFKSLQSHD